MSLYQDIYMRDYAGDKGEVPSDTRQGVSASPDIIPWGPDPNPDYMTDLVKNYDGPYDYIQNIDSLAYNYIYTRALNNYPSAQSGSISLYYSRASLLLWPTSWAGNRIQNVNGGFTANLSNSPQGAVCVGQGAFYWQPPSITNQDHYCLIAQVVTQQDPNAFPETIADFAAWVSNNANIAWRNVSLVKTTSPQYSAFVVMSNPVNEVNNYTLTVTCTNVPDGAVVTLVGSESSPPINFQMTVGPSNQTGTNPKINQIGWTVFNVPAQFTEAIQLSANLASGFPKDAAIRYNYYWLTTKSHRLASLGVSPSEFHIQRDEPGVADQGTMLPLGDYTFQF